MFSPSSQKPQPNCRQWEGLSLSLSLKKMNIDYSPVDFYRYKWASNNVSPGTSWNSFVIFEVIRGLDDLDHSYLSLIAEICL